jgi:hypothetical protein
MFNSLDLTRVRSLFSVAFCIQSRVRTAVVWGTLLLVGFQVPYLACLTAVQVGVQMGVRMGCLHSTALSFNSIEKLSRTSQIRLEFLTDKIIVVFTFLSDSGHFTLQVLSTLRYVFSEICCATPVGLAAGGWRQLPKQQRYFGEDRC